MTSLICLVCRCNLKDRRLIKENEPFETDEIEAEILIRGGIAKLAAKPVEVKPPVEKPEVIPAKVVEKQPGPASIIKEVPNHEPEYTQVSDPEHKPELKIKNKPVEQKRKRCLNGSGSRIK